MLLAVRSNNSSFKTVEFRPGYNIILADRTLIPSGKKNSRNGAGKTTLVEIIHFCLGAQVRKGSIFKNEHLKGWSFILDFAIGTKEYSIERFTDTPSKFYVEGDFEFETKYDKKLHRHYISQSNLNKELLLAVFGYNASETQLSYRELISYIIRKGTDGYRNAFEYYPKQKPASIQTCNSYFLNLNLDYAKQFQDLKDKKTGIENYKKAVKAGVTGTTYATIGELNSELIMRQQHVDALKKQLDSFKVHPQYEELSIKANELTDRIHESTNELVIKENLLERYITSLKEEKGTLPIREIQRIYDEAGVIWADTLTKSLEDIIGFHKALLSNRREYLSGEIERLRRTISEIKFDIKRYSDERAELLNLLEEHGALREFSILQEQYSMEYQDFEDIKKRLEAAEYIESSKSKLQIENQELLIKSRQDYSERLSYREQAISIFRDNTSALYPESGTLTIDLDSNGYKFDIEIKNSRSQGVNYMKILCYDLTLIELGMKRQEFVDFLVHDSTIFDGVDERQIANALQLAKMKCDILGFQYICLMNSDMVPYSEFASEFKKEFDDCVILKISDEQENGGILGIRF